MECPVLLDEKLVVSAETFRCTMFVEPIDVEFFSFLSVDRDGAMAFSPYFVP